MILLKEKIVEYEKNLEKMKSIQIEDLWLHDIETFEKEYLKFFT